MNERGKGRIEVIFGCMFSGKSREVIRRLKALEIAVKAQQNSGLINPGLKFEDLALVVKPEADNRRGKNTVNSKDGDVFPAISIVNIEEIFELLNGKPQELRVVAVDEAQFFDRDVLVEVCRFLADAKGKRVIVAGLPEDFRGEPWGGILNLIAISNELVHLKAVCSNCGSEEAVMTQRLKMVNGKWEPADYYDPVRMVGEEQYQARCRDCHRVTRKDSKK